MKGSRMVKMSEDGAKYVWRDSDIQEDTAILYNGDVKICVVFAQHGTWFWKFYRHFKGVPTFKMLGDDFDSIAEVERAVTQYIYDVCTDQINTYLDIREHLPDFDGI